MSMNAHIDRLRLGVPEEIRGLRSWLCWRKVSRAGSPKFDKIPLYPGGGQRKGTQGGAEDRAKLGTFDPCLSGLLPK